MKRTKILGLCLMVACAIAAVSVASASASAQFGSCVGFKHGNFTESNCATVAEKKGAPDHKGTFEFVPADSCYATKGGNFTENKCITVAGKTKKGVFTPDHKGGFESTPSPSFTTSSGPAELTTPGFGAVKCSASTGGGVIESGTTETTTTSFTGCESSGQKCQNTATEGNIVTFLNAGVLTEPTTGTAATVLTAASGKYLAEFGCTGVAVIRTGGSVGGHNTPVNTVSSTSTFTFEKGFDQNLETEFSASPAFEPAETVGPFPSEQHGVFTIKTSSPIETHVA
jgi:hypothetical protein